MNHYAWVNHGFIRVKFLMEGGKAVRPIPWQAGARENIFYMDSACRPPCHSLFRIKGCTTFAPSLPDGIAARQVVYCRRVLYWAIDRNSLWAYPLDRRDVHLVLNIGGKYLEITGPYSDAFVKELWETVDAAGFDKLVLDFSGTQIVSTMALGAIASIRQKLREQNRDLQIINASEKVIRLLHMTRMTDILRTGPYLNPDEG